MSNLQSNEAAAAKRRYPNIVIKGNNCATNDPCAICGERTDPVCGPELFLEGTWALVCRQCGLKRAPYLVEALDKIARRNQHESHEAEYPGELRDLSNALDGYRQQAAHELGVNSPLFRLIDGALRLCDAPAMREALRLCHEQWPGEGEEEPF